jgi:hypothetical protein
MVTKIEIKKVGRLKYDRLKSISVLRKELSCFGNNFTHQETKEILDSIISGNFDEEITEYTKYALDKIFDNMEYDIEETPDSYCGFKWPYIMPIG